MSSKQANSEYQLITPPEGIICPKFANSRAHTSIPIPKRSCPEMYLVKLKTIKGSISVRMQNNNFHLACKVLGIFAAVILIAFAVSIAKSSSNGTTTGTMLGLKPPTEETHILHDVKNLKRMVLLNIDFDSIPPFVEELEINSLLLINPYTPKVDKNKFIRKLVISCPISEQWIEFLLTTFPEVESLSIDEDGVCGFRNLALDESRFPALSLPNLTTLKISNANGKCPLSTRVFSKWTLKNLKHLSFSQPKFDLGYCSLVNNLLTKLISSIESTDITCGQ